MKILFCTDGSQISFNAINNFAKFSKQLVVDIICVIDWHFYPLYLDSPVKDYQSTYETIAEKILDLAQKNILQTGNLVEAKITAFGNISEEILKQTKKHDYDLIVMGSHGKKGFRSWLGSVSREVLNTTKKNVFISKNTSDNKKILFTTDGSEYSELIIKKALEILDLSKYQIYILHAQKDLNNIPVELRHDKTWVDEIISKQNKESSKHFKVIQKIFSRNNLKINQEITLIGEPTEKILEFNKEIDFDLIVMGSHSKNAIQRLILGSTSMRVLERAQNSVMIISAKK